MNRRLKLLTAAGFVALVCAVGLMVTGAVSVEPAGVDAPLNAYAPKQPIDYSHKLHAGQLEIECEFCHTYARRSRSAGIPAGEQCIACHQLIATQSESIKYIAAAYDRQEPVEWVKVHDLPDYVYFSHKRHVSAGFECQECHGPIEEMDVVYRHAPMTMGWCVNCHQDNLDKGAQLDCLVCHK